jgi:predicted nucleic acid-binding protein
VTLLEPTEDDALRCKLFFPSGEGADAVHAATCLHIGAILISNDAHFKKIKEVGLIKVWTISEAIDNLFD